MASEIKRVRQMADRYSEPGARWLPNLPVANDELRELLRNAFEDGAHYQRQLSNDAARRGAHPGRAETLEDAGR